jgi:hypothetical protein
LESRNFQIILVKSCAAFGHKGLLNILFASFCLLNCVIHLIFEVTLKVGVVLGQFHQSDKDLTGVFVEILCLFK